MRIRKGTLEKTLSFLNECKTAIKESNGNPLDVEFLRRLARKYTISNSIFYDAVEAGLFHRTILRSVYENNQLITELEPIHARRVLQISFDKREAAKALKKQGKLESLKPEIDKIHAIEIPKRRRGKGKPKLREFSILWGLIKFQY